MSVRTVKTQCAEPGGVRTVLVPTAASWTASLASMWRQMETALVSRKMEVKAGGLGRAEEGKGGLRGVRRAKNSWFFLH